MESIHKNEGYLAVIELPSNCQHLTRDVWHFFIPY